MKIMPTHISTTAPLVASWQKMGFSDEDIDLLCDMVMEGDRGVADANGFKLHLGSTIGSGCDKCNIHFTGANSRNDLACRCSERNIL